jgi:DNA-binding MarR family transcriptional regulator
MSYLDYKTRYSYLKPITIAVLIYIYDNGGETVGFRDLVQKLNSNNQAIKETIMHLTYNGLITKDTGPNNVMIIRLTEKGEQAAKILKELIKILEE